MRILLTTTSFQDTPGPHHEVLKNPASKSSPRAVPSPRPRCSISPKAASTDFSMATIIITAKVIDAALPRLRVIAKYGIGLDSIDVKHATAKKIPVLFTPGVNHTTVAEHCFGLMIAMAKHFWPHLRSTKRRRMEANHRQ